jgi:EpsI family protein
MWKRIAILAVCLAVAKVTVMRADRYEEPTQRSRLNTFPAQLGDWHGVPQEALTKRVLEVLGVEDYLTRAYFTPDRAGVGLYIGYWASQRQGDTIHSPQNCLPGAGFEPVSQSMIDVPDPRHPGSLLTLNRYVVRKGNEHQLVVYWYQSHGRIVASEYWGKIYMVVDAVRMNRTDGAIVRVIAPYDGEDPGAETKAEQQAVRFINDLIPQLDPFLPL